MLTRNTRLSFQCPKRLDELTETPDPAVRFCDGCGQHVFDLSSLTEVEAEAVKAARGCDGRKACIAFASEGDEVLVQPGAPRSATRIVLALAAAGLAIPAGAMMLGGAAPPTGRPDAARPGAAGVSLSVDALRPEAVATDLLAESGRLARAAHAAASEGGAGGDADAVPCDPPDPWAVQAVDPNPLDPAARDPFAPGSTDAANSKRHRNPPPKPRSERASYALGVSFDE